MKELLGHYVNYRKQVATEDLPPEKNFRLYGVCARFPDQLAAQVELRPLQAGVLECRWGTDVVRLIVLRDLPREEHNAPLHLFSAMREQVQYGQRHYQQRSPDTSSLIQQLLTRYQTEGVPMPYTMEDFRRGVRKEMLDELTPEERLAGLDAKERVVGLSDKERERLLEALLVQQLQGMPSTEIEEYFRKLRNKTQ